MRQILTILLLMFSTISLGQTLLRKSFATKDFEEIPGLYKVDTLNASNVAGTYTNSNGFTGYRLILDSNRTFRKIEFDCVSHSKVDSGEWRLRDSDKLILTSGKITTTFDVIKIDNYYFIILQRQRQKFINDYIATKAKFKNAKPFIIDGEKYSVEYLIGFSLINKYLAKEFDEHTGT